MKKKIVLLAVVVLALLFSVAAAASKTVYLPDQYLSAQKYGSQLCKRQPNTVVYSLTADGKAHWGNVAGGWSNDEVGEMKATLKEYDPATDTMYVTRLHITTKPIDKQFEFHWDQSLNSETFQYYKNSNGDQFPVGMNFSFKHTATYGDRELEVVYSSNNTSVATIDQNGWVTLVGPGTVNLEARCPEMETGNTTFLTVYSENTGGKMWAEYTPKDPAATCKVYAEPSTSSKVLFTFNDDTKIEDQELLINFLAKRDGWLKITCQLGIGWVEDNNFHFYDGGIYESPALQEGETITGMPTEEVYSNYQVGSTLYASSAYGTTLYKKADKASDKVMDLPLNTPMTLLGREDSFLEDSFLKVKCEGKTGYVLYYEVKVTPVEVTFDRDLTFPCTMYVYTSIEDMALWKNPGSIKIDEIPRNTKVTALGVEQKATKFYIMVEVNGKTGYMDERYLTSIKPEDRPDSGDLDVLYTTTTKDLTKVYMDKSTSSGEVSTLGRNHRVRVVNISGSWAYCKVNSDEGYIRLSDLNDPDEQEEALTGELLTVVTPNGGTVNMRKAPSKEAGRITTLTPGTKVALIRRESYDWYKVRANGQTGYIMAMYLMTDTELAPDAPGEETQQPVTPTFATMVVKTANGKSLNMRKTPSSTGQLIERYPVGTKVTVLSSSDNGWYKVSVGGKIGYMMAAHLVNETPVVPETPDTPETPETPETPTTPETPETPDTPEQEQPEQPAAPVVTTMTVKTANGKSLNMRKTPSSTGQLIERYPVGTQVTVLDKVDNTWYQVRVNGQTGYMMAMYLVSETPVVPETPTTPETPETPSTPETPETTPDNQETGATTGTVMVVKTQNGKSLNLRQLPRSGSKVIGQYPVGTQVTVINELDAIWNFVKVGGQYGYMMDQYLVPASQPAPEGGTDDTQEPETSTPESSDTPETGNAGGKVMTVSTENGKSLNLRQAPKSGATILGQYPVGTQVTVLNELDSTWNYVRVGGAEGYMMDKYLK